MSAVMPKRRGRPKKEDDPTEDEKTRRNREAQNRYRQKVGKQVGGVVDDLDICDEERAALKEKVKGLTKLLADCETQVHDIMSSVKAVPIMKGGYKAMGAKETKTRKTPSVIQNQASTIIGSSVKQKLARKRVAEAQMAMKPMT